MSQTSNPQAVLSAAAQKRKRKTRLWIIIGSLILIGSAVGYAVATRNQGEKPISVTVEKASVRTLTQVVTATGKVQPEVEVRISSEVAGELIDIPVKEGQLVKKGEILAKIKPDLYQAQVDQQEASLAAAKAAAVLSKARLIKAEQDFSQSDQLYAKKLISEAEYTTAKTSLEVAKAELESANAQIRRTEGLLNQYRDQINKTIVYSPMDGTISALNSKVGERVLGTGQFAGTEIMRVADLANMEVRVKVNENDIVNVKVGDRTVLSIDAFPSRKFEGKVYEISNSALSLGSSGSNAAALAASASDEVTNFLVKIRITDASTVLLRPGMSATVDIETQTVENVVSIPIQSVTVRADGGKTTEDLQKENAKKAQERSGNELEIAKEREQARRNRDKLKRVVFLKTDDTVKMAEVETGIADNTYIEVKSGVKAGDEVVSGTYAAISRQLKDGKKVTIDKGKKEEKK